MDVVLSDTVVARQHFDLGLTCFHNQEFALAVAAFDAALALTPNDPYARWNRATALLSLGEYERGFVEHDVAWRLFHWRGFGPIKGDIDRISHLPVWKGERDERLLVYHELGFGDAIMAMRFLPELTARCEVTLVIDDCLVRLAQRFDDVEVVSRMPDDVTAFDSRLPFFAVMSALGTTAETIPSEPYIAPSIIPNVNITSRIGIAWSGRTQTAFTLERFLQLCPLDGFDLYALQPGVLADDWIDPLPPGCDFLDVAERIAQMDAIVSVDTAAIHLAGAMGHPNAHLVLPHLMDWRWWRSELWYPQLKTYRQTHPPDWSGPFAQLNEALARTWVRTAQAAASSR